MKRIISCGVFITFLLLAGDGLCQSPTDQTTSTDIQNTTDSTNAPVEGSLSRWLQLNTLSLSMRYRSTYQTGGFHMFESGQERSLIDGAVKLDAAGKYAIHFHASSGNYFNWSYSSMAGTNFAVRSSASLQALTPAELQVIIPAIATDPFVPTLVKYAGAQDHSWNIYLRQLYMSASPIKQLTLEYGSMPIEHGLNTEMTTYDDDGFLTGGRIRIKDPKHLFLDQIAFTAAYVGNVDLYQVSVFQHGYDFQHSDYQQYLGEKKIGKNLDASVDFTQHSGTHTFREALLAHLPANGFVDSVRGEFYQRTNTMNLYGYSFSGGNGFGITAARTIKKHLKVEGGFAAIDKNYSIYMNSPFLLFVGHAFNGDAYSVGNRFFYRASYKPVPFMTMFGFYTHVVDTDFFTINRQSVQGGIELDVKEMINQKFHLF